MMDNNVLQWQVFYFDFEKETQQELEWCIYEKSSLLQNIRPHAALSKKIAPVVNIHIYFFPEPVDINAQVIFQSDATDTRVLCISDFHDFDNLLSCIQTGAYGCISISNMFEEIVPAIQSVLQNKVYLSPALAPLANNYFRRHKDPYADLLTSKETKLIQLLTNGALYKEIAWKLRISENTVRSHVRNIYSKMNVHSKTELTRKILNAMLNLHLWFCFDAI